MHPIDLHMIVYQEPQWMVDRMLASLEGQPINIYIIDGKEEWPPYMGRMKGFFSGSAEYCTFVDPDDEVEPGGFEKLLEYAGHDLIWGNELVVNKDNTVRLNKEPHHAYLVKRSLNQKLKLWKEFRPLITADITRKHVDSVIYTWNFGLGTTQRMRDELYRN